MSSYPIGIVGESFDNDDGTSRQREIRRCSAGEPVALVRNPENKYDSNCVNVVSARGVQIGNISRDDSWICERLDRASFIDARILSVHEGTGGKLGVVICVRTSADDEWLEDQQSRATGASGCSPLLLGVWLPLAIGLIAAVAQSRMV
ncbi:MAG: hypothetical protein QOH04_948 [Sphingomonadales bacterium]|jgi:hypothetical protein|nr:hypothetical protein [Sphingomonadales bacterium]